MKLKRLIALLLTLVLLFACAAAHAEEDDDEDSEASLMELLEMTSRRSDIALFAYGDYDMDGVCEAFALLSEYEYSEYSYESGELWFVSPRICSKVYDIDSYETIEKIGVGPSLLAVEIGYGGSGSHSVIWGVERSETVGVVGEGLEGISSGDVSNEFYMHPTAFDASPDGTGHTWKRYYYFLDGLELVEYGGLEIGRDTLERVPGASEILSGAESEGWSIGDIYYRSNGIINVNLYSSDANDNLTLRFDGASVTDTGNRFGGIYEAASGLVTAVWPDSFPYAAAEGAAQAPTSAPQSAQGRVRLYYTSYEDGDDLVGEICAGAFDGGSSPLYACSLISFMENLLEDGAAAGQLWALGDDLYYAEARFGYEGVQASYAVLRDNGGGLEILAGANDPGYSEGQCLADLVTGEYWLDSIDYDSELMITALDDCFAAYGLAFSEGEIDMQGGYGLAYVYTAADGLGQPVSEWNSASAGGAQTVENAGAPDDQEAYEAVYETLEKGSRGESVQQLQQQLIALGLLNDTADGIFGSNTTNAVKDFQRSVGMTATGIADTETQRALFSDSAASSHSPARESAQSAESGAIDLADYLGTDIEAMARQFDLTFEDISYCNDVMHVIAEGYSETGEVDVIGLDAQTDLYCIAGASLGMARSDALEALEANGWYVSSYGGDEESSRNTTVIYENAMGQQLALETKGDSDSSPVTYLALVSWEGAWS